MELNKFKNILKEKVETTESDGNDLELYFFGSILNKKNTFSDIDILIIYEDPSKPQLIRKSYSEIQLPLHLTFLTRKEEEEFNFINETEAKKIYP